ncbi:CaiB/BaiF CoA-transferase family protein [Herbaspirillum sp.]|uniref:CaiB/BaiF CoA transferase family protein n=1 Tax=Herbaspirillum sp. TaxID=1890675 RepID=UPI0031DE515F
MSDEKNTNLPLQGVRVIEFVHMVMGPTCGLVLADLGAEVIKIEPESGDNTRRLMGSGAGYWVTYNRNKKSVAVDLKSESGLALVKKLIASADVVTENFRPGAMEKIGLDYESLKAVKPDLIYCSMKGFLPGPYENRAALDEVVQMMSGLAYMTGPEGRPLRAGASVNDVMGGMFAAIGILSAIIERGRTGKGQLIRSGLYENSVFLVGQHMAQERITGKAVAPMPNRVSAWAVYDVFTAKDDEQVFIGVVSDTQWQQFCEGFGLADLANDSSLALNNQRVKARDRFMPYLREKFATMSKAELMALCEKTGLPFAPIKKPVELFDDEHLLNSGGLTPVTIQNGQKIDIPALPLEMGGRRFGTRLDVPGIGSHTDELAEQAGVAYTGNHGLAGAR